MNKKKKKWMPLFLIFRMDEMVDSMVDSMDLVHSKMVDKVDNK